MKKLLTVLFLLIFSITYSQSGVGYLNYTIYNIRNTTTGAYANSSTDFVNMFDVTKGAILYSSGVLPAQNCLSFQNGFTVTTPNGGAFTGIKFEGYFVPKETGIYSFGIDGDDGVDFSLDGVVVTSFYGAHGFGGYRYGTVSLVAGNTYKFMARYQNWGGGWGMFLVWKRPSQNTYSIQSDEVTTTSSNPTKKGIANFNFNNSLDATKFSVGSTVLSSNGSVNITSILDSTKVSNGYKGVTLPSQVEWCAISKSVVDGKTRILIDMRQIGNITPSRISSLKLLDIYDGPITYVSNDATWGQYDVPVDLPTKILMSSYLNSNFRGYSGYYGVSIDFTFSETNQYKLQSISLTTTNNLTTLYNSIVTVSDVYMAFQEYSNKGLFGNQVGSSFTYGIQYKNADVNNDGVFDESDCFALLQNLTGAKTLVDTFSLNKTLRIIPQLKYDSIGKSNWNTFLTPTSNSFSFDINTGKSIDTLNFAISWKGDVNLSHSTTPKSNNFTTMSLKTTSVSNEIQSLITSELVGDSVVVTITLNPMSQSVVGAQFMINYDNTLLKFSTVKFTTKGNPSNFGTDKGTYVNLGSLFSDGTSTLDQSTSYKISFKTLTKLNNIFGLISVVGTDAVNQGGTQLKIRLI